MGSEKTVNTLIARHYHPTIDGSMGRPVGFFLTWGNRTSPLILWADLVACTDDRVMLWEVKFFGRTVRVVASLGWKFDYRGEIRTAIIEREDGEHFTEAFRLHYVH